MSHGRPSLRPTYANPGCPGLPPPPLAPRPAPGYGHPGLHMSHGRASLRPPPRQIRCFLGAHT
eukprot:272854-Chlamydomonas_euryale.AAC.2